MQAVDLSSVFKRQAGKSLRGWETDSHHPDVLLAAMERMGRGVSNGNIFSVYDPV